MAVRRSQLLARLHGTHYRISSGIQRLAQTVLGVYLKRTCSRITSASSALMVLNVYALYKSTHSLTHYFAQLTYADYVFLLRIKRPCFLPKILKIRAALLKLLAEIRGPI